MICLSYMPTNNTKSTLKLNGYGTVILCVEFPRINLWFNESTITNLSAKISANRVIIFRA